MRPLLPLTLAALVSFGVGFAGGRFVQRAPLRVEEKHVHLPAPAVRESAAVSQESSPAAAKERIAAVLALAEKPRGLAEDHALFVAIGKLNAADFPAGADEMLALFKKEDSASDDPAARLAEAWMERWLEVDAAGALRFLESSRFLAELPTGASFYGVLNRANMPLGGIFKALARRQPDATRELLAATKPGAVRETGTYLLLRETAQGDPAKAKLLLASLGDGGNRPAALQGYIAGPAEGDVHAGFETALAEPAGPLREQLLETVLDGAAKRGVVAVQELVERIDDAPLRRTLAMSALWGMYWNTSDDPLPWIIEESKRQLVPGVTEIESRMWANAIGAAVAGTRAAPAADWALTLEGERCR